MEEEVSKFQDKKVVLLVALFCTFLWGSAIPATKLSFHALDMVQGEVFTRIYFAGLRFFVASLIVFVYLLYVQRKKEKNFFSQLQPQDWRLLVVIGLLRITVAYYFYYIALSNMSGVKSAVFVSSSTFITVMLAPLLIKEDKLNSAKIIALILGFTGIIVANISDGFDMSFSLQGEGYMLLNGLVSSLVEISIRPKSQGVSAPLVTWGQLFFGSIPLIIIGYIGLERSLEWNGLSISLLIYGAFISALAFILWYELLKVNNASEITMYRLFIPIFGAVLSAIILPGESFTITILLGLIFVVLGIVVLNIHGRRRQG